MLTLNEVRKVMDDTRKLYRLSLTEDEAQDGWVNLIIAEMKCAPEHSEYLRGTKYEFCLRMDYMNLSYHNIDKCIAAVEKFTKESRICP